MAAPPPTTIGPDRTPPRLLAITDRRGLGSRSFESWLDSLARAGVDALQVREKDLPDREVLDLLLRARKRLPPSVRLLVNGRVDLALAAGIDGVHLPAAGLPADRLRRWAARRGAEILIGRSTHRIDEVEAARAEGADYVTFGPVFHTPSKAGHGPPAGPEALARAAEVGIPVIALGGVDAAALEIVTRAGASGAAGIRLFQDEEALSRLASGSPRPEPDSGATPVVDSRDEPNR